MWWKGKPTFLIGDFHCGTEIKWANWPQRLSSPKCFPQNCSPSKNILNSRSVNEMLRKDLQVWKIWDALPTHHLMSRLNQVKEPIKEVPNVSLFAKKPFYLSVNCFCTFFFFLALWATFSNYLLWTEMSKSFTIFFM